MMLRSWSCGCIELSSKLNGKVTWAKNTPRRTPLKLEDPFLPVRLDRRQLLPNPITSELPVIWK